MEVLVKKPFNYAVLAEADTAYIVIVCGTSALFDVWIKTLRVEALDFLQDEPKFLALIASVRGNPENAKERFNVIAPPNFSVAQKQQDQTKPKTSTPEVVHKPWWRFW